MTTPQPSPIQVRFRLLRATDTPLTNPHALAYRFGLQDTKGNPLPGTQLPSGALRFDISLTAKPGKDPNHPAFTGPYASGPADDRFAYLSWWAIDRNHWINRLKARLSHIDWPLIHSSRQQNLPITADLTDWQLGDPRKYVSWHLDETIHPN